MTDPKHSDDDHDVLEAFNAAEVIEGAGEPPDIDGDDSPASDADAPAP